MRPVLVCVLLLTALPFVEAWPQSVTPRQVPKTQASIRPLGRVVVIQEPAQGEVVNSTTPDVRIAFRDAQVRESATSVRLDGQDITGSLIVTGIGVFGQLGELSDGPHELTVEVPCSCGGDPFTDAVVFTTSTGGGVTRVLGRVLDPITGSGIPNVQVFFEEGGPSVLTDPQGSYVVTGAPVGTGMHLSFIPDPSASTVYPRYKRPIDVWDGATTRADDCYLPPITDRVTFADLELQGIFDCSQSRFAQDYVLSNLGVELEIAAGTYVSFLEGAEPCTQYLAIANVPVDKAPSNLPRGFDPNLLITVQPTGMKFLDEPDGQVRAMPVSFPNRDELPPGNETTLWSVDHDLGIFVPKGALEVDPGDPTRLRTISGGLEGGSWHANLSISDLRAAGNDDGRCFPQQPTNPLVSLASGFIVETVELPKTTLFEASFGEDLVYSSRSVVDNFIVRVEGTILTRSAVPSRVSARATLAGVSIGPRLWWDTSGFSESQDTRLNLPFVLPTQGLPNGVYPLEIGVSAHFGSSTATSYLDGELSVLQRPAGAFGRGWCLSGDHVVLDGPSEGDLTLFKGDGSVLRFRSIALLSDAGLSAKMFSTTSDSAMLSYFETSNPATFTVRENGRPAESAVGKVVPNVDFWNSSGPYLLHVGANGVQETSDPSAPGGDDITLEAPGSQDAFGVLLEGYLDVPQSGEIVFAALVDDAMSLEIGGVTVMSLTGINPSGLIVSDPVTVSAGAVPIRLAYVDKGGRSHAILMASGAGLPGGVLPESRLYSGGGVDAGIGEVFAGIEGEYSTLTRFDDGTYRRDLPDKGFETYDAAGRILTRIDRRATRMTQYQRDTDGALLAIIDPKGRPTTMTWTGERVTVITDPAGRTTQLAYSGNDLTSVTDATGEAWLFSYDSRGLLTSRTDPEGDTNRHEYDSLGRFQRTIYPDGTLQEIEPANLVGRGSPYLLYPALPVTSENVHSVFRNELGHETRHTVDDSTGEHRTVDPLGRTTVATFDPDHRRITRIEEQDSGDEVLRRTSFVWDFERGLLIERVEHGDLTSSADDRRTRLQWHSTYAWLERVTEAAGTLIERSTQFTRDSTTGNVTRVTRPGGEVWTLDYGSDGELTGIEDATLRRIDTTTEVVTGNVASIEIGGNTWIQRHDAAGQVIELEYPDGSKVGYTYDALSRLETVGDPLGAVTTYAYTPSGQLASVTDAKAIPGVTLRSYDARGRPVADVDPLGVSETFEYYPDGRMSRRTDRRGTSTDFFYDEAGRLVSIVDPSSTWVVTWDDLDQLRELQAPGSHLVRSYTAFGELQSEQELGAGDVSLVSHAHDALGQRIQTDVWLGGQPIKSTTYAWNAAGRLDSLVDGIVDPSLPALSLTFDLGHDLAGRRIALDRSSGVNTIYGRDPRGVLESVEHFSGGSSVSKDLLGFDVNGNVTSWVEDRALLPPNTSTYSYDATGRLLSASYTDSSMTSESFGPYDEVGNRRVDSHTYDVADQLLSDGTLFYDYDSNGNVVAERPTPSAHPAIEYDYDLQDQLVGARSVDSSGQSTPLMTADYDALGRRLSRDGIRYVYDGEDIVLAVDAQGAHTVITHGPGFDEPWAVTDAGGTVQLVGDVLGSTTLIVSSAGVVAERRYEAFGDIAVESGSIPVRSVDYAYRSREWDAGMGQYYLRARYYDADVGRFGRRDPFQLRLGATSAPALRHPYLYALASPLSFSDPTGLLPGWMGSAGEFLFGAGSGKGNTEQQVRDPAEAFDALEKVVDDIPTEYLTPTMHLAPVVINEARKAGEALEERERLMLDILCNQVE